MHPSLWNCFRSRNTQYKTMSLEITYNTVYTCSLRVLSLERRCNRNKYGTVQEQDIVFLADYIISLMNNCLKFEHNTVHSIDN